MIPSLIIVIWLLPGWKTFSPCLARCAGWESSLDTESQQGHRLTVWCLQILPEYWDTKITSHADEWIIYIHIHVRHNTMSDIQHVWQRNSLISVVSQVTRQVWLDERGHWWTGDTRHVASQPSHCLARHLYVRRGRQGVSSTQAVLNTGLSSTRGCPQHGLSSTRTVLNTGLS